jgi:hypothetical protein
LPLPRGRFEKESEEEARRRARRRRLQEEEATCQLEAGVLVEACVGDETAVVEAALLLGLAFPVDDEDNQDKTVFDCNQRDLIGSFCGAARMSCSAFRRAQIGGSRCRCHGR